MDPAFQTWFANVDLILHAGDVGSEAVLEALRALAPTVAVCGNMDGGAWALALPLEEVVEVEGTRIALLHIAGSPRKPHPDALDLLAREEPDILLVGHSHIGVVERCHGTLWVNPGAAGLQGLHTERTAAILHLGEKRTLDWIRLGPRSRRRG